MKRIVVLSDIQAPLHDDRLVASVTEFLVDYQPDVLLCVGDEADMTEISRWVKGGKEEFAGNLQAGLDQTHAIMAGFREAVGDVPFTVQRSNHTDRIANYVRRYAPALESLRGLSYESLLKYNDLGISVSSKPTPIAPGWLMMHGDEAGTNQSAGGTSLGLARKTGQSVACGHTHKLGLQHDHDSYAGRITKRVWGMEVGHMMNLRRASYLKYGGSNWQAGFGLLHVFGTQVYPQLVPAYSAGSFSVDGVLYGR